MARMQDNVFAVRLSSDCRPSTETVRRGRPSLSLDAVKDPELRAVMAAVLDEDRGLIEYLADR
jgi:hypothetical protein